MYRAFQSNSRDGHWNTSVFQPACSQDTRILTDGFNNTYKIFNGGGPFCLAG